ncbi:MAG: hypothetical protein DRN47_01260 [Candidatus Wolframiiraptor sp.]|nr:MAG: hypothetical protein DRN47_01260 [Candidatus Wolframiiraptor sp.]
MASAKYKNHAAKPSSEARSSSGQSSWSDWGHGSRALDHGREGEKKPGDLGSNPSRATILLISCASDLIIYWNLLVREKNIFANLYLKDNLFPGNPSRSTLFKADEIKLLL